jgi:hypothetical protein
VVHFGGYSATFATEGLSYSAKYPSLCTVKPEPNLLARLCASEAPPQAGYGPLSSQFQYRAHRFPSSCVLRKETQDFETFATYADTKQGDVILSTDLRYQFLLRQDNSLSAKVRQVFKPYPANVENRVIT